jgi:hypothetical protein
MPWSSRSAAFSIDQCLDFVDVLKLQELTKEPSRAFTLGTGDGIVAAFTTPFYSAAIVQPYRDGTLASSGFSLDTQGAAGRTRVIWSPAPASGVVVTAISPDGAIADSIESELLEAQKTIRAKVGAKKDAPFYAVPSDAAVSVDRLVVGWAWRLTMYGLATGKRLGLVGDRWAPGPYYDLKVRRDEVMKELEDVAAGDFLLDGILPVVPSGDSTSLTSWVSNPRVFRGANGAL